jgi:cell division protein FtsN
MTQDFARKKRSPQKKKPATKARTNHRHSSNSPTKAPAWAWLVIGLLLAALVTLLIYLANQPKTASPPVKAASTQPKESKPPQPRFDFYEILKDQEIEVPDRSGEIAAATPENVTYYLQAGSFRNRDDADELRAQLLLLNMDASIETTQSDTGSWHRVIAGPFNSRSKMAKARSTLVSKNINPLVLKRKTN